MPGSPCRGGAPWRQSGAGAIGLARCQRQGRPWRRLCARCASGDKPGSRRTPPRRSWWWPGQWLQGLRGQQPLRLLANLLFVLMLAWLWPTSRRSTFSSQQNYTIEVRARRVCALCAAREVDFRLMDTVLDTDLGHTA